MARIKQEISKNTYKNDRKEENTETNNQSAQQPLCFSLTLHIVHNYMCKKGKKYCLLYSSRAQIRRPVGFLNSFAFAVLKNGGCSSAVQIDTKILDKTTAVVLDIESLAQLSDRSSGSPIMIRTLSRKWSYRGERWNGIEEEDIDDPTKKLLIKGNSQLETSKQPVIGNKSLTTTMTAGHEPNFVDIIDSRNKRFNRLMAINPRKILFAFATLSSMGTLMLIYFTLAINRTI